MTVHRIGPTPELVDDIPEHAATSRALKLAGQGLPVFPCKPSNKAPYIVTRLQGRLDRCGNRSVHGGGNFPRR